jgi:hypothetical protein
MGSLVEPFVIYLGELLATVEAGQHISVSEKKIHDAGFLDLDKLDFIQCLKDVCMIELFRYFESHPS